MSTEILGADVPSSRCDGHMLTIYKCIQASKGGNYIFRGSTKRFSAVRDENVNNSSRQDCIQIRSTLLREIGQTGWKENFTPFSMEKEIVDNAAPYFPAGTSVIDVLTELRHYGQDLSMLDFTQNIYVALFFACYGDYDNDGELIIFRCPVIYDFVCYDEEGIGNGGAESAFIPSQFLGSKNRVLAQSSIFVRTPKGYIDGKDHSGSDLKIISIPARDKKLILDHLLFCQNITFRKIYNDVVGYVCSDITKALLHIRVSKTKLSEGEHRPAIDELTKALEKHPQHYEALYLIADTLDKNDEPEKSLVYLNKAVAVHPNPIEALYRKGQVLCSQGIRRLGDRKVDEAKELLSDALESVNQLLKLQEAHEEGQALYRSIARIRTSASSFMEDYTLFNLSKK